MQKLMFRLALLVSALMLALIVAARIGRGEQGDAARGEMLFAGNMIVCFACHTDGTGTLMLDDISSLVLNSRLKAPENVGKTPEQFLAESILFHGEYVAPDSPAYMMPTLYTRLLNRHDLQDLVAYLLTL